MARKQIVLRLDVGVNKNVRRAAKAAGLSINAYCEQKLDRASKGSSSAARGSK